jgi:hypothetical protein
LPIAVVRKGYVDSVFFEQTVFFVSKGNADTHLEYYQVRPMAGLAVSYKRVTVSAEYIHGLINYQRMMDGANPEVYSRYLRFGLGYRLF